MNLKNINSEENSYFDNQSQISPIFGNSFKNIYAKKKKSANLKVLAKRKVYIGTVNFNQLYSEFCELSLIIIN